MNLSVKGIVNLKVFDAITSEILREETENNNIVYGGFQRTIETIAAMNGPYSGGNTYVNQYHRMNKISFGTNGGVIADPSGGYGSATITNPTTKLLDIDPANLSEPRRYALISSGGNTLTIRHFFSLLATEGNGKTIREMGLISSDYTNNLETPPPGNDEVFARITREPIVKTSAIRLEGTWDIIFKIRP